MLVTKASTSTDQNVNRNLTLNCNINDRYLVIYITVQYQVLLRPKFTLYHFFVHLVAFFGVVSHISCRLLSLARSGGYWKIFPFLTFYFLFYKFVVFFNTGVELCGESIYKVYAGFQNFNFRAVSSL